jgi:hypothetical protein
MLPIRNIRAALIIVGCLLLAGCQTYTPPTNAQLTDRWDKVPGVQLYQPQGISRVDTTPIQVDPAMRLRDWSLTPAVYDSLSMTTGYPKTPLEPADYLNPTARGLVETPVFLANVLLLPVTLTFYAPPGAQIRMPGLIMPASYTANPPQTPLKDGDYSGRALGGGWETVR